jgi:YjbE family integral membrane protein
MPDLLCAQAHQVNGGRRRSGTPPTVAKVSLASGTARIAEQGRADAGLAALLLGLLPFGERSLKHPAMAGKSEIAGRNGAIAKLHFPSVSGRRTIGASDRTRIRNPQGGVAPGKRISRATVVKARHVLRPLRREDGVSETFAESGKGCGPYQARHRLSFPPEVLCMELLLPEFLSALVAIVIIDLVLAGDNAIVIALAARDLPKHLQKRAVLWGTAGAIVVRALMTLAVVWLLRIPGLMLAGGLLLVWIAFKLLRPATTSGRSLAPAAGFWSALKTIVVADCVMGLDNVLAVAGAAHGSFLLVVLGLLISVPIMIGGSRLLLHWIERVPAIIYVGAAVLAWTAAQMIVGEPLVAEYFSLHVSMSVLLHILLIVAVLGWGYLRQRSRVAVVRHV